jgi:hypothetical protein
MTCVQVWIAENLDASGLLHGSVRYALRLRLTFATRCVADPGSGAIVMYITIA